MNHPIFVYGDTICVYRYKVDYVELVDDYDTGEVTEHETSEYFADREKAKQFASKHESNVTSIDTADYDWLDGIKVDATVDPMGKALEIYNMGREAWEARQAAPTTEERVDKLNADVEYIAMLTGVDLEV